MNLSTLFVLLFFEEIIIASFVRIFHIGGGILPLLVTLYLFLNYLFSQVQFPRFYANFLVLFLGFIFASLIFANFDLANSLPDILVFISGLCILTYKRFKSSLCISPLTINFIFLVCILTTLLGIISPSLDAYHLVEGVISNRSSGLFREPSHAGYYYFLLYFVSTKLFPSNSTKYFYLTSFLLLLNVSLTSVLMLLVITIDYNQFSVFRSKIFLFSTFCATIFGILNFKHIQTYLSYRLPSLDLITSIFNSPSSISTILYYSSLNQNPTFASFAYYWSMLIHFLPTRIFGFGFNSLSQAFLEYNSSFPNMSVSFMSENGGFLLVQLVCEIGFLFTFIFLLYYFLQFSTPSLLIYASLSYLMFRGWGLSPLIFWAYPLFSRPSIYPRLQTSNS